MTRHPCGAHEEEGGGGQGKGGGGVEMADSVDTTSTCMNRGKNTHGMYKESDDIARSSQTFRHLKKSVVWLERDGCDEEIDNVFYDLYNKDEGFGNEEILHRMRDTFEAAMQRGIQRRIEMQKNGSDSSAVVCEYDENEYNGLKMLRSFIPSLPCGNEKGIYYCVDVGGTNLRVMKVNLSNFDDSSRKTIAEHNDSFDSFVSLEETEIPQIKVRGGIVELFDFIAERIVQFIMVVTMLIYV